MKVIFLKIKHFYIKMQDILITDIRYLLPCVLTWFYHRKIKKDIFLFKLKNPHSGKKASLYQHGKWKITNPQSILILHGLYSHPCVMQHLAKVAQKANIGSVFSLYVRYEETNLNSHRFLINQAINSIEKMQLDQGYPFKGIILVGHSMGAIEASYIAFVENNKKILSVISIAGRLKVVESVYRPCRESLKDALNKINKGVQSNPSLPLYQIVGQRDWNAPLKSTVIRKKEGCYRIMEEGMHFNILFHQDIYSTLSEFLQKSSLKEKPNA
ncbi:MAG: hypothetical protein H0V82_07225 [Candidatus Protochlamydia sp.]|nr:hypothetical protein [Candidatus Protochlamydia sp.]